MSIGYDSRFGRRYGLSVSIESDKVSTQLQRDQRSRAAAQERVQHGGAGPYEAAHQVLHTRDGLSPLMVLFVIVINRGLDDITEPVRAPLTLAIEQHRLPENVDRTRELLNGLTARRQIGQRPVIIEMGGERGADLEQVTLPGHHQGQAAGLECVRGQAPEVFVNRQIFFCVWRVGDNDIDTLRLKQAKPFAAGLQIEFEACIAVGQAFAPGVYRWLLFRLCDRPRQSACTLC